MLLIVLFAWMSVYDKNKYLCLCLYVTGYPHVQLIPINSHRKFPVQNFTEFPSLSSHEKLLEI